MKKKYVVAACGYKKDTGEFYCIARAVIKTKTAEFLSDRDVINLDDVHSVGECILVEQSISVG